MRLGLFWHKCSWGTPGPGETLRLEGSLIRREGSLVPPSYCCGEGQGGGEGIQTWLLGRVDRPETEGRLGNINVEVLVWAP